MIYRKDQAKEFMKNMDDVKHNGKVCVDAEAYNRMIVLHADALKMLEEMAEALQKEGEYLSMRGMLPLDKDHHILKALNNYRKFKNQIIKDNI